MSILIAFILFFAIVIWLLSVPIEINLSVDTKATHKLQLRSRWLYGLLNFKSSKFEQENKINEEINKTKKLPNLKNQKKKDNNRGAGGFILAMIKSEGFLKRVIRFITDCFKSIRFRDTQMNALIGLGDPADTGNAVALLAPIFVWIRLSPIPRATLEVDYYQPIFRFTASTTIRIIPLDFVRLFFFLLFSPTLWRSVKSGIVATSK